LSAGLMMIMVGIWQALEGLIAIFENEFYVATRNYLFQVAVLSAIANFLWLPYYPFWALLIIAVDVFVTGPSPLMGGRLGSDRSRARGRDGENRQAWSKGVLQCPR
jgi:hypothetical protein